MKTHYLPFTLAIPVFFAFSAYSQSRSFRAEAAASEVTFELGATLHRVHGIFHVESGAIDFDIGVPTISGKKISGKIVVSATSGGSGDESRDRKMKKEVLDTPHFADVSFVPKSYQGTIAPTGDSTIQVTGTFTLHGTEHESTIPARIHIDGTKCTVKAVFPIPYVKWGLKDPSTFVLRVAKEVNIDLTLVGVLTP